MVDPLVIQVNQKLREKGKVEIPFCVNDGDSDYSLEAISLSTQPVLTFHRVDDSDKGRYWLFGATPDATTAIRGAFVDVAREHISTLEEYAKGGISSEDSLRRLATGQDQLLRLIVSAANMGDMTPLEEKDTYMMFGRMREILSLVPEALFVHA